MADQFEKWDRFTRNYKETGDAMRAKRWLAYEEWAAERRRLRLQAQADTLAAKSAVKASGSVSEVITRS